MLISRVLSLRARTRRSRLWALRDIDLQVDPGECLGVIGRNGSGKSTPPAPAGRRHRTDRGSVAVSGRVAPLSPSASGFHPELTGRENVYVNGIVLGLSRAEIDQRFDEIVDFAEIGDFIDTPVKFYSSGMFVRLGFAVAVAVDPAVLLVDEVLVRRRPRVPGQVLRPDDGGPRQRHDGRGRQPQPQRHPAHVRPLDRPRRRVGSATTATPRRASRASTRSSVPPTSRTPACPSAAPPSTCGRASRGSTARSRGLPTSARGQRRRGRRADRRRVRP